MYQSFAMTTSPATGASRLAALRAELSARGLDGFLVPRDDAHQGEYVAPHDERLSWLTGFTGSAGTCAVLPDAAGVFIDGRYTLQVRGQIDLTQFTPVPWTGTEVAPWIAEHLAKGVIGIDPWLHTPREIAELRRVLSPDVTLQAVADNPLDAVWADQPAAPSAAAQCSSRCF